MKISFRKKEREKDGGRERNGRGSKRKRKKGSIKL
jgi:hypothetical protein